MKKEVSFTNKIIETMPSGEFLGDVRELVKRSQKFKVGKMFDLPASKDIRHLSLPYQAITIEGIAKAGGSNMPCCLLCSDIPDKGIVTVIPFGSIGGRWGDYGVIGSVEKDNPNIVFRKKLFCSDVDNEYSSDELDNLVLTAMSVVLRFVSVLECKNIYTEIVKPSKRQQKKRKKKGKLPFFEYHVLKIKNAKRSFAHGGTHASPRVHLRRGHIRRLSTGGTTWVSQCIVGNKKKGMVVKDYSL